MLPLGQVTSRSLHKNQVFCLAIWTCTTTGISNVAIIIAVASNDPQKYEATNENSTSFYGITKLPKWWPRNACRFHPRSFSCKKERRRRVKERGKEKGKKEVVHHKAYNAAQKRMINFQWTRRKKSF